MQTGAYSSLQDSVQKISKQGVPSFYRSTFVPQTLLHDVTYSMVGWVCYESLMDYFGDRKTFSAEKSLAVGTLAG